jgi:hypothetical protein
MMIAHLHFTSQFLFISLLLIHLSLAAQQGQREEEPMEGKKKRLVAAAVCVLVILLSAKQQRVLPVADAASAFCQCYASCYPDCRANHGRAFCKVSCGWLCVAGDQAGGGCPGVCQQASLCGTVVAADGDGGEPGAADAAAACEEDCAKYWKAKHG